MLIRACRAKIHLATVTGAHLNYEGSITVDEALLAVVVLVDGQNRIAEVKHYPAG